MWIQLIHWRPVLIRPPIPKRVSRRQRPAPTARRDWSGRAAARDRPLWVGSVKSNIGHLESAAGVTGLIKLVLAMCAGQIPPTLHIHQPNPKIDWDGMNLRAVRESVEWPRGAKRRLAALSSFGVSGSNAHLILEEAPPISVPRPDREARTPPSRPRRR